MSTFSKDKILEGILPDVIRICQYRNRDTGARAINIVQEKSFPLLKDGETNMVTCIDNGGEWEYMLVHYGEKSHAARMLNYCSLQPEIVLLIKERIRELI